MSATGFTIIAALPIAKDVAIPGSLVGFDAAGEALGDEWVI